MIRKLYEFFGGVRVPGYKDVSCLHPVEPAPLPSRLTLPLSQHIGAPAETIVKEGEHVLKGQLVAKATDYVSAPIHAPTSGTVIRIGEEAVPHPSGMAASCIVIKPDGKDAWISLNPHGQDYQEMDPSALRNLIRKAGIVGLGGAGFPSYIKLNPGPNGVVDTLILNGAECEPFITCDAMLMQDRANEIVGGLMIMRHALQAKSCLIAIEDNKPKAIAAMQAAVAELNAACEVVVIPTIYPAGGEKQLIYTVTGKEVPANGLPIHIGIVCQNVGTTAAIFRAVTYGEPLVSRYVTIAGDLETPRNLEVLFGTPVDELVEACGGTTDKAERLIMGGPMMGFALHSAHLPVVKTTNCILIDHGKIAELQPRQPIMPCIRCGSCADVCPASLSPQQLYWYAKAEEFDQVQEYNLFDCIECGCCDYVCPSHIPLVQYYRYAKGEIWQRERDKQKSDIARERFEFRQQRIEAEKAEREAKRRQKKAALKPTDSTTEQEKTAAPKDNKQAAILAALERAKAKKEAQQYAPKNTDNLTPEQQKLIEEIDRKRTDPKINSDETSS